MSSYIPQDVQSAVCDRLLRLSSHFREYFCSDLSATRTPGRPTGFPHSSWYGGLFSSFRHQLTDWGAFSAHRFLVGYVYGRTRSQTGGLLQIWLLKRFASLIALQPIILGLILLTRELWPEGGALVGAGIFTLVFVEVYTRLKERSPGVGSLSPVSQHALESFGKAARPTQLAVLAEESLSIVSSGRATRTRGSFASVLEMMSMTLAVEPAHYQQRGPVPIRTSFCMFGELQMLTSVLFVFVCKRLRRWTTSRRPSAPHARTPTRHRAYRRCRLLAMRRRCRGSSSRQS
jgi:hypothetical protein